MTATDSTVMVALGVAGVSVLLSLGTAISLRRQLAAMQQQGRQISPPVSAELSMIKHEFAMLSEMVHRFRAQSLAGIADNMKEKEEAIRQQLHAEMSREINSVTQEFDRALSSIVARVDQKQEQYASRLDELTFAQKPQESSPAANLEPKVNALLHASVVNRFLTSLEDAGDRRKCLLASIDSVHEVSTLGKLAVAYPAPNSWLILKELADHGVVSDVAGWALVAGAEMTFAAGDKQRAEELYQAARLSFSAVGGGMHGGLYIICTGLARVLSEGERAPLADALRQEAQAHLQFLSDTQPAELAITAVQLAEFYLGEERYECAAVLFRKILELAGQVYSDFYASEGCQRLWNGLGRALFVLTGERPERDQFRYLDAQTMEFIDKALTGTLPLEHEFRDGLLLCMLRLAEREKEPPFALSAIKRLFDESFPTPVSQLDRPRYEHLASEVLHVLDELGLSRKKGGMPVLRRLVGIFVAVGNYNKAASAGAKLVDAALDIHGDASAETVAPISLLADVYMTMERYDLCEECYRQILEMQYKIYTEEHEDMIATLLSLAHVCRLQKDDGEAEIFLETALEICNQVYAEREEISADEKAELDRRKHDVISRAEALKAELVS